MYIDYSGDGYYMYNRQHPRDRVAVNVYVNKGYDCARRNDRKGELQCYF